MAKGFTGAGFLVGGLVGGAVNRAEELNAAKEAALNDQQMIRQYQVAIEEWETAGRNLMTAQFRLKADYEGMLSVVRELLNAIQGINGNSPILLVKNRDLIAGEASRLAEEKYQDSMFSLQKSCREAIFAVIQACTDELRGLAPNHRLLKQSEQFSVYWVSFQKEIEARKMTPDEIRNWAQSGKAVEPYMKDISDFIDEVPAAWRKQQEALKGR